MRSYGIFGGALGKPARKKSAVIKAMPKVPKAKIKAPKKTKKAK